MSEQPDTHDPLIEPTQNAFPNGYNPYSSRMHTRTEVDIPPPPPPLPLPKKRKTWLIVFVSVLIMLLISMAGIYIGYSRMSFQQQSARSLNATATVAALYTAQDIVDAFVAHGLRTDEVGFGESVSNWMFGISILPLALSSAQFEDNLGCGGPCADTPPRYGVWVYATSSNTRTVYQEVVQDLPNLLVSYPAAYQWRWYAAIYADNGQVASYNVQMHGRCLLLGANANSQYTHIMQQYCI